MSRQPDSQRKPTPPAAVLASAAGWALALWVMLIPSRAHVMGYGWYWLRAPLSQGPDVVAGAYLDLAYAAGLGAVAAAAMLLVRRRPLVLVVCRILVGIAAALSALVSIANIDTVRMLSQPLTWPWLYYSGFLRGFDAQQAIAASFTPAIALGMVSAIVGLFVLAWLSTRLLRSTVSRRAGRWAVAVLVVLMVTVYPFWARAKMTGFYPPALENPVVAFVTSIFAPANTELFDMATPIGSDDFRTAGEARAAGESIEPSGPVRKDNVLLIVLESGAAEYLDAYGASWHATPNLDRYLAGGRKFTSIYSHAPNTNKGMVSLLCSLHPWPTYRLLTQEYPAAPLAALPDVLAAQGYRTGLFYAADLRFGNARGFLEHHRLDTITDLANLKARKILPDSELHLLDTADDESLVDAVADWVGRDTTRPFAALVWTGQTHYPYHVTGELKSYAPGQLLLNRYLNSLAESDRALGRLLDTLREQGRLDSTLVVVVGDHGEAFGQHNRFGHGKQLRPGSPVVGAQYGHGSCIYEENIHVPLLMIHPALAGGDRGDPAVGGLVDIAPTVLDFLGQRLPDGWQGRSLLGARRPSRTYFVAPWSGMTVGYRQGDAKYLYDAMTDRLEMFDLAADPREQHDLSAALDEAQRLEIRQRLAAWLQYQSRMIQTFGG